MLEYIVASATMTSPEAFYIPYGNSGYDELRRKESGRNCNAHRHFFTLKYYQKVYYKYRTRPLLDIKADKGPYHQKKG